MIGPGFSSIDRCSCGLSSVLIVSAAGGYWVLVLQLNCFCFDIRFSSSPFYIRLLRHGSIDRLFL